MNAKPQHTKKVPQTPRRILGLVASPRSYGNCELFTKEISQHIEGEHTLRLIRLTSLNIKPCRGCYRCIMDNPCPNKDDMEFLMREIVDADAVILSSPVYFLGANGIIKNILDRAFLFYQIIRKTYGTPCILINFYGIKDRLGMAPQMLQTFSAFLGLTVKASVNIQAALPGEALMSKTNLDKAKQLADILFSTKNLRKKYGCPFCNCEIIRIVKKGFICTLCHGHFTADARGGFVKIKEGPVLGPPEHLLLHKEWLKTMKTQFLAKRKELVKIISRYKDIGEWIKP
ncbi:MAG: hypothetical protein C0399_07855 [Syntrophus sp. (in: bacteria)]|nr:hypothetical protein [Syntrophus sp. (in: bacteria)]